MLSLQLSCPLVNLSEFILRMIPSILKGGLLLLQSLVSRTFLVLLRYSFLIFFSISTCLIYICFQYSQVLLTLLLFKCSDTFLIWWFYFFCCFSFSFFPLFITIMAHFSMSSSIPIYLLYILIVCIRIYSSFSFSVNTFMSSMYIR